MPTTATRIIHNCATGETFQEIYEVPDPTVEELAAQALAEKNRIITTLVSAVQNHLDATAKTRNYDGILSLCSYATSLNPIFGVEGQAGVVWRDACWAHCYQVMADVEAELRTIPTTSELIAELPVFTWGV